MLTMKTITTSRLIAHAANRAGLTTKLIRIDEVIFDETLKIWKDPEGERIENLFKLYSPGEDMGDR